MTKRVIRHVVESTIILALTRAGTIIALPLLSWIALTLVDMKENIVEIHTTIPNIDNRVSQLENWRDNIMVIRNDYVQNPAAISQPLNSLPARIPTLTH